MTIRAAAFIVATSLAVLLASCASKQQSVAVEPSLAKESSATLVVYRPSTKFHRANPELPFLYVNGQQIGKLAINGAIEVRVPAGEHALSMKEPVLFMPAFESHKLTLKAEAGKTYFVRYTREFGGVMPSGAGPQVMQVTGFDLVPEEIGKQRK